MIDWSHTSGTTGKGLRFPETRESLQRHFAYRVFHIGWGGVQLGEPWAYCAGHSVADPASTRPPFWTYDYFQRWLVMSSYHLTKENLQLYIDQLARFRPVLLAGYPSSIYLLALANRASGLKVRPRAVVTSSETLFEPQKRVIEESFGCTVFSYYGNAERAAVILQCEEGKYHVRADYSHVEILDAEDQPVGPGGEGRLVCTSFANRVLPLIRYDVGDTARVSENANCRCGRVSGLLLESLTGRTEDYIATPDGRLVGRLDHIFKDALKVVCAQIEQFNPDEVVLRLCVQSGFEYRDEEEIRKGARLRLGPEIKIRFQYVDAIPRTAAGKHRFVISHIPSEQMRRLLPDGTQTHAAMV
jgi:phenylacetate-CoA ligase